MKMWMVGGYNDTSSHHQHHHQVVNLDGFNGGGRKLRPLIPRPPPAVAASPSSATTHSCNFGLYTASHLFGAAGTHEQGIFSHKINAANNFNKEEEVTTMTMTMTMNNNNNNNNMNNDNNGGAGGGVMSSSSLSLSRWNPTAEQVRTLEELYRRGTRTPSTDQIQRITAQLRRYGKIEGKNVFYWFQNHKARERQKRRRHGLQHNLPSSNSNSNHHHHDDHRDHDADADDHLILPRKEPAGPASGKQCFEAERTRSHYSAADAEECGVMSMQRARVAEKACTEHNNERNNTWHNLAPSSPSLIERIFTSTTTTPTITDDCAYTTPKTRRFIASLKEPSPNTTNRRESYEDEDEGENEDDDATLQLFPMRSQVDGQQQQERDQLAKSNVDRDVHFFEFFPPKLD